MSKASDEAKRRKRQASAARRKYGQPIPLLTVVCDRRFPGDPPMLLVGRNLQRRTVTVRKANGRLATRRADMIQRATRASSASDWPPEMVRESTRRRVPIQALWQRLSLAEKKRITRTRYVHPTRTMLTD